MSRAADSIRRGLEQAVRYAKGEASKNAYRVHVPEHVDVKAIRTRLRMTQRTFAARFGFSVHTPDHRVDYPERHEESPDTWRRLSIVRIVRGSAVLG